MSSTSFLHKWQAPPISRVGPQHERNCGENVVFAISQIVQQNRLGTVQADLSGNCFAIDLTLGIGRIESGRLSQFFQGIGFSGMEKSTPARNQCFAVSEISNAGRGSAFAPRLLKIVPVSGAAHGRSRVRDFFGVDLGQ